MSPLLGGWIHHFTVTDTQTHKGGYTIYKITSIVFPRSLPQALTCLTIWKRFHDIKRLHRELFRRHRSLGLPGQLPEPTDCSFFKRFDADIIRRRKEYILQFLDFVSQHPSLYKCHAFTQFFSEADHFGVGGEATRIPKTLCVTAQVSPLHILNTSEILKDRAESEICDKVYMQYDHYDTAVNNAMLEPMPNNIKEIEKLGTVKEHTYSYNKSTSYNENGPNQIMQNNLEVDKKSSKDYTRFLTPMASIESDDSDYIYEAALEFSRAVQAEASLDYHEAHLRYKRGVELLLIGSKDDTNDERKFIAKSKILKYLARADDIYDKFLSENATEASFGGIKNFQLSIDVTDCAINGKQSVYLERPWNHLAKYKVLKVLGDSVMLVYCVTEPEPRTTYVMKGIEKPSSNMPTQTVFLPQHVPYIVDLLAFFQSEQKIFLLLKYAEGGRLFDYMLSYVPMVTSKEKKNFSTLFPDDTGGETTMVTTAQVKEDMSLGPDITNAHDFKFVQENNSSNSVQTNDSAKLKTSESTEFSELVRSSQQLLQSVNKTLQQIKHLDETPSAANKVYEVKLNNITPETAVSSPMEYNIELVNIPEASLKQWARELAVAIHSLHGKGVILRDLHMENLLLGVKGQLLLTYFYQNEGLSDANNYIHKAYSPTALAGHYVAPERPLTFKSDWWSYGIVLYQLLFGLPFKAAHPGSIDLYGFVQYPENDEISECAKSLLEILIQQAPEERADFEQIQAHAFFAGTDWEIVRRTGFRCTNNENHSCKENLRDMRMQ